MAPRQEKEKSKSIQEIMNIHPPRPDQMGRSMLRPYKWVGSSFD
jgi:hypothetical protein